MLGFHGSPFDLVEQSVKEQYVYLVSQSKLNKEVQIIPCHNYPLVQIRWYIHSNCSIVVLLKEQRVPVPFCVN